MISTFQTLAFVMALSLITGCESSESTALGSVGTLGSCTYSQIGSDSANNRVVCINFKLGNFSGDREAAESALETTCIQEDGGQFSASLCDESGVVGRCEINLEQLSADNAAFDSVPPSLSELSFELLFFPPVYSSQQAINYCNWLTQ